MLKTQDTEGAKFHGYGTTDANIWKIMSRAIRY